MVRFGKKETTDKRQLLASMNSMHYDSSKQIDNVVPSKFPTSKQGGCLFGKTCAKKLPFFFASISLCERRPRCRKSEESENENRK
ncbi:hypothetical protein ZHAS_00003469 [Anopheles sinensis]|uniref:Uncharacterized protein n=1 Tax=Anopheles sinensis TaxID=74873 RepID=A0A084VEB7_ANOSI|nr:hypothetical protein ZHAS_00003469 [Anopheles sinensis]